MVRLICALWITLGSLLVADASHAQTDTEALVAAARKVVKSAWEKEMQPFVESSLNRIDIHAVERRNRLAPGQETYLVHAFAETSWWKDSEHYLLLLRPSPNGFETLYRFDGGSGGHGLTYRLVDLGSSGARRFALEISDQAVGEEEATGTWTILVMQPPEGEGFVEVFRELTTYRPPSNHGYESALAYRSSERAVKDVAVSTTLLKAGTVVERVESIFTWQVSSYEGIMPLPEAWRSELPSRIER